MSFSLNSGQRRNFYLLVLEQVLSKLVYSCSYKAVQTYKSCSYLHVVSNQFIIEHTEYRGSCMSAYVLLNLLNELGKRDKMRGLASILLLFTTSLINSIIQEHE